MIKLIRFSLFLIATAGFGQDIIIKEKDLVPEGLAYNNKTRVTYVSSTHKQKILAMDVKGKQWDFVKAGEHGIGSVLGMEVDEQRDRLWVNSCFIQEVLPLKVPDKNKKWRSAVYCFSTKDGKLLKKVELKSDSSALNDLTVLPNGDVYITETTTSKIYTIAEGRGEMMLFIEQDEFKFFNGITSSADGKLLYVSCNAGILQVNVGSAHYQLIPVASGVNTASVDGLALYDNSFVGHQSNKVTIFALNAKQDSIVSSRVFDTGKEFDSSTTGEIAGNDYIYIVNSQIQSAIDYKAQKIRPYEELEDIIIRRRSLKN